MESERLKHPAVEEVKGSVNYQSTGHEQRDNEGEDDDNILLHCTCQDIYACYCQ